MQELIKQIEDYGRNECIDKLDPLLQTTKTLGEIIELQQAIIRYENKDKCNNCEYLTTEYEEPYIKAEVCGYIGKTGCTYLTDIKDAISDIFITLVMLHSQSLSSSFEIDCKYYTNSHVSTVENADNLGLTLLLLEKIITLQNNIKEVGNEYWEKDVIHILHTLCKRYNLTLKECVEHAYNEIVDGMGGE